MSRKNYTHIQTLLPGIKEMISAGKSHREIEEFFGLTGDRPVHNLLKRERRKERKLQAGIMLRPFTLTRVSTALLREMAQDLTDEKLQERRLLCGIQFLLTPWLLHCETEPAGGRAADALRQENQILDRSLEYIATHTQKKLTVETVAKNCSVSIPYLSQLFRRHLKTSPGAYLQHVRLEQAGRMLRRGMGTVSEIADELHYSSPQHFCTAFKKQYGISPLQYAKSFSTIPTKSD